MGSRKKQKRKSQGSGRYFRKVFEKVRQVPAGKVATYGQIATLIGHPGWARQVGWALHSLSGPLLYEVPWHRIINQQGTISSCSSHSADLQRRLLEAEGIIFDSRGRVDLRIFQWRALR
ncbi:MAG: MGMT family protein [Acidobacteria bacterium]|nr:MGMT family protein [Acidobacteriota bacterium]